MLFLKNQTTFWLLILLLLSCEKSTNWELETQPNRQLVVEAILTNELKKQEIRLSQTFSNLNDSVPPVTEAEIWVNADEQIFRFIPDTEKQGQYLSNIPFAAAKHLDYQLTIEWSDTTFTAISTLSNVTPIPEIIFKPNSDSTLLAFDNFVPIYHPAEQAMYEVDVDWSHLSNDFPNQAKVFFYTFSSVHINEIIRPPKEEVAFPKGSIIVIKKYGLNDDFAAFLMAKAIETEWNGSFFYSNPDNIPSNLDNGALGFFSTCAVMSDTLIAE